MRGVWEIGEARGNKGIIGKGEARGAWAIGQVRGNGSKRKR